MPIRVVVSGTRDARPVHCGIIHPALDAVQRQYGIALLAHGDARGVDTLADAWAVANLQPEQISRFPVTGDEWNRVGRSAGVKRNAKMIHEVRPNLLVAFPARGLRSSSPGTWNAIELATEAGIAVRIFPLVVTQ